MKILIVGCHGMLGSELMAACAPIHDVIGVGRADMDITQLESCLTGIGGFRPDAVINAAAFTRVDYCETHEEESFLVNAHGVENLARAAAAVGSLLVHYSTDYIFDGLKQEAYVEQDTPNPKSVYGKSKLLGETLVRQYCPDHMILRISWLFGPNGANFIRTTVEAARRGASLRVVNDQKGSPTYAKDVAAQTLKMIAAGCRSTYHVTNSGSCSWYELASKVVEWAGIKGISIEPIPSSEYPRPAPRPVNSLLSNARIEQEGLPRMRPWQEAAREYVEGYLKI